VLRGEKRELVNVFWRDMQDPPLLFLRGTNSFGIEDITLYCNNYRRSFVVADSETPESGDVFLRRVCIRTNAYREHVIDHPEEADQRFRNLLRKYPEIGQHELAYDLLTSRDNHSWAEMLRHGATAPLEAWAPDQKWNTSFCHPCGGTPIYLLVRYVMGLQPALPGWKAVKVTPQLPAKLERMKVQFPTMAGPIVAEYEKVKGYCLTVPKGVDVQVARTEGIHFTIKHA
jgi:hypothetical protein